MSPPPPAATPMEPPPSQSAVPPLPPSQSAVPPLPPEAQMPRNLQLGSTQEIKYLLSVEAAMLQQMQELQSLLEDARRSGRRTSRRPPASANASRSPAPNTPPEAAPPRPRTRVISVSLRLPSSADRASVRQQLFDLALPPKGVLSLEAEADLPFIWVGLPNADEPARRDPARIVDRWAHPSPPRPSAPDAKCVYVPLDDGTELMESFLGFSENTLYRVLHYDYGAVADDGVAGADRHWEAYKAVNQLFAQTVSEIYEEGDLIWVHNHHLMLLPGMIRERLWYAKIGFFLYTAFPSSELFRILPMRTQILNGVLGADLVGFYSYDYSKQFVSSCSSLLGLDTTPSSIDADPRAGRKCSIGIYPAGIDVKTLKAHVSSKLLKTRVAELREQFANYKLIVGVDRLDDCFAGIPLTLLAFEKLLQDNDEYIGRVVLVQVAMLPGESYRGYGTHRTLMTQINELVGAINAAYGSFTFSPVHYINAELNPSELHSLMCAGHVCIVSKVRDGMGLVPHEWTVCQHEGYKGPIVLSEFSGSARSFSTALHVNPWDVEEVALKLKEAIEMDEKARTVRNEAAYRFASEHSAALWGYNFLDDLEHVPGAQHSPGYQATRVLDIKSVIKAYKASSCMSAMSSPMASTLGLSALGDSSISFSMRSSLAMSPSSMSTVVPQLSFGERSSDGDSGIPNMGSKKSSTASLPGSTTASQSTSTLSRRTRSRKKLFVIDYEGTLSGFQPLAEVSSPPGSVRMVISNILSACSDNVVLILSGRDRRNLAKWFGDLDVFLAAEDGCFLRQPGEDTWLNLCAETGKRKSTSIANDSFVDLTQFREPSMLGATQMGAPFAIEGDLTAPKKLNGSAKKMGIGDRQNGSKDDSALHLKGSVSSVGSYEMLDVDEMVAKWKGNVKQVMEHFAERTPGVLLEEGDAMLTWHYMDTDRLFGHQQARALHEQLESFQVQSMNVSIVMEESRNRWLKVCPIGVNKATAVSRTIELIGETGGRINVEEDDGDIPRIDFILCIGDDKADECMFDLLCEENWVKLGINGISNRIFTCHVGSTATAAMTCLETPAHVVSLLDELIKTAHGSLIRTVRKSEPIARSAPS